MDKKREPFEVEMSKDEVADVIRDINRYYSEVTIIKVSGECPYGHKEGEKYKVTGMNHAGICGGLWHVIQPSVLALQYEGGPVWEKAPGFFKGLCSEMGRVQVEVKRKEKQDTKTLKIEAKIKEALSKKTGKTIVLNVDQDPDLIGGVVTKIGDLVLDGSVRTQLMNMSETLKKGEIV